MTAWKFWPIKDSPIIAATPSPAIFFILLSRTHLQLYLTPHLCHWATLQ
jgi:hypothetical protein